MGIQDLELSVLHFMRSAIANSIDINARIGVSSIVQSINNKLIPHYSPNFYHSLNQISYFTDSRKAIATNFYNGTVIIPKMHAISKDSSLILNNLPIIKSSLTEHSIPRLNFVLGHYSTVQQNSLYINNHSFILNSNLLPNTILQDSKAMAGILSETATHYTKLGYNLSDVNLAIQKALNSFPKQ